MQEHKLKNFLWPNYPFLQTITLSLGNSEKLEVLLMLPKMTTMSMIRNRTVVTWIIGWGGGEPTVKSKVAVTTVDVHGLTSERARKAH